MTTTALILNRAKKSVTMIATRKACCPSVAETTLAAARIGNPASMTTRAMIATTKNPRTNPPVARKMTMPAAKRRATMDSTQASALQALNLDSRMSIVGGEAVENPKLPESPPN